MLPGVRVTTEFQTKEQRAPLTRCSQQPHAQCSARLEPLSWHRPRCCCRQGRTSAQNSAYMSFAVNCVTGHSFVTEQRSQAVIIRPMTRSLEHSNADPVSAARARRDKDGNVGLNP